MNLFYLFRFCFKKSFDAQTGDEIQNLKSNKMNESNEKCAVCEGESESESNTKKERWEARWEDGEIDRTNKNVFRRLNVQDHVSMICWQWLFEFTRQTHPLVRWSVLRTKLGQTFSLKSQWTDDSCVVVSAIAVRFKVWQQFYLLLSLSPLSRSSYCIFACFLQPCFLHT